MIRRAPMLLLLFGLALASITAATSSSLRAATPAGHSTENDPYAIVRGMTVSCQSWGWEWGSDGMFATMDDLKSLGVNWIAIHPYAGIRKDGTVGSRRSAKDAQWLRRPIEEAHKRGLKICIKPHMAHWGSGFSWAGDIKFETDEEWRRFFTMYEQWLVDLAETCHDADALCIGTEIDGTIAHVDDWRRIIAAVRTKTKAPLTYASNWDAYERVTFWDALDVICVHGYFPLCDQPAAPVATATDGARPVIPEQAALDAKWMDLIDRLETFGNAHGRKVVLGELGYDISMNAAVKPWEPSPRRRDHGSADALEIQRRCLSAALKAVAQSETVMGAFLWKWFPGDEREDAHGENFLMSTPAMREVIAAHWKAQ
jgi:hypothetical protein